MGDSELAWTLVERAQRRNGCLNGGESNVILPRAAERSAVLCPGNPGRGQDRRAHLRRRPGVEHRGHPLHPRVLQGAGNVLQHRGAGGGVALGREGGGSGRFSHRQSHMEPSRHDHVVDSGASIGAGQGHRRATIARRDVALRLPAALWRLRLDDVVVGVSAPHGGVDVECRHRGLASRWVWVLLLGEPHHLARRVRRRRTRSPGCADAQSGDPDAGDRGCTADRHQVLPEPRLYLCRPARADGTTGIVRERARQLSTPAEHRPQARSRARSRSLHSLSWGTVPPRHATRRQPRAVLRRRPGTVGVGYSRVSPAPRR